MLEEKIGMWNEIRAHGTNPVCLCERTRSYVRIYHLHYNSIFRYTFSFD